MKGYEILDASQQVIYHRLARANWVRKIRMMHE